MVLIKLGIVILVLLGLIAAKRGLCLSLLLSSALLLLLNQMPLAAYQAVLIRVATDSVTYTMLGTILSITVLGYLMGRYHILDRMVNHLEGVLRSTKLTLLAVPPMVGLLLVAGGALMSCPIVDQLGDRLNLSNDKRAACNLVYRHALHYAYPLSTSMILTAQLGGFAVMDLVVLLLPIAVFMLMLGYFLYLGNVPDTPRTPYDRKEHTKHIGGFLLYSCPITISIFIAVLFSLPFHLSLPFGILCAVLIHQWDIKKDASYKTAESFPVLFWKGINFKMLAIVTSILLFKQALDSITQIPIAVQDLIAAGLPIELIIVLVSLLIAYSIGDYQPVLALLMPIAVAVASSYNQLLLYAFAISSAGFSFYFISPLHMCQLLTLDYFKVSLKEIYRCYRLMMPLLMTACVLWYLVLKLVIFQV